MRTTPATPEARRIPGRSARSGSIGFAPVLAILFLACVHARAGTSLWNSGSGEWADAAHWPGGLPDPKGVAAIEGSAEVTLSHGDVMLSRLDLGAYHNAHATMIVNGGDLTLSKVMVISEMTGTSGKFIQNGGNLRALEICVGAANVGEGADRHASGELEIRGGSVLTRHLTFGWGFGSTARLCMVGSKAKPLAVLDYLWIGVRQKGGPGSAINLDYEIDSGGVTPIVVWSKQASVVALIDDAARSTCRLGVSLKEKPPIGDIPLIRLPKPCRGIFTDLPEGSAVRAEFGKETYEWTLTYRGGPQKTDIVLTNPRTLSADGGRAAYTAGAPAKAFELTREDVDSGLREMDRRATALLKPIDPNAQRAFPSAEGYGAFAKGGRGGRAIFVTNLNDAGPGSLREALLAKGPRTVIFQVGGAINLRSPLVIREPYVTVAGQTAPGNGICIRADSGIHADGFVLNQTHDVILRYLRVQHGKGAQEARPDDGGDCISVYDSENFIIDHCSTHWGTDETLSVTGAVDLYTVQWTIISEGLNYDKHSMSSILCGDRCTWHHNLFAHEGSRNPLFTGQTRCDFRNNVIYDWGHTSGQGNFARINYTGNFLRPGRSTVQKPLKFIAAESVALPGSLYLAGNVLEGSPDATRDNWQGAQFDRACGSETPFPMPPVQSDTADIAFQRVLDGAGATAPKRDTADARVIADVKNGTGGIIASQEEVGGWPEFPSSTAAPVDSDGDGIPDEWERQHGLNPNDPSDAATVAADGYTWLEKYLNEIAGKR